MNHERGIVLYFEINILKPTMRAFSPKKVSDIDAIVFHHICQPYSFENTYYYIISELTMELLV